MRAPVRAWPLAGRAAAGAALFCATLLVPPPGLAGLAGQQAPEPARGPEIQAVSFPGADGLAADRLADAIATAASECKSPLFLIPCLVGDFSWAERKRYLDRAEVERDAERLETLYEIWGYPDARVEPRIEIESDGDAVVAFQIDEGAPIRVASLEIRGVQAVQPPLDLPDPLPLRVGVPYALPRLEETQELIRSALSERGHPYGEVEVTGGVDESAHAADVVLTVRPGPLARFGDVSVRAAPPIDEPVVRERVAYEPGEPFRPSALERTEAALYDLPVVGQAIVRAQGLEAGDTVIPTLIAVSPRKVQGIELEGTLSSAQCLQAAAFWRHRYFLGGPRIFSLGVGVSNLFAGPLGGGFPCGGTGEGPFDRVDYFARAELLQPWPGSPETTLLVGAFASRSSVANVYLEESWGGQLGVSRRFAPAVVATTTYSPERVELDAAGIYFCGNFGICSPALIAELSEPTWLAPLELTARWTPFGPPGAAVPPPEEGEDVSLPRWMYWARAGVEGAAAFTASDYEYGRSVAEAAVMRRLGPRLELAAHTRLGLLEGEAPLPPQTRLYSGGVNTVRGLPQNMLGPKALVTSPERVGDLGCIVAEAGCPAGLAVDPDLVNARPLGGTALLEGNLEARYWVGRTLQLAAFVDYGALRVESAAVGGCAPAADGWASRLTPGAGVRVLTDLGPVRLDVGYDASGARTYPLLTDDPQRGLVCLGPVLYDPIGFGEPGGLERFWRRLQLHVAIGQAF